MGLALCRSTPRNSTDQEEVVSSHCRCSSCMPETGDFHASKTWEGAREGFYFSLGKHGLGYYKDRSAMDADEFMIVGNKKMKRLQYLAGYKGTDFPQVPTTASMSAHTQEGTIDDLAKKYPELDLALYNDVKVCEKCGKPCAFTMSDCNSCGTSLAEVKISKSENVFSAFLFGVQKASKGFPYTISLRRETDDVLIFDDMLSLTPCHLNGISRKYYIPDWRFLLTDPPEALKLIDTLERELWEATRPFLEDKEFRSKIWGNKDDGTIRSWVMPSFNFPPSQFQLHVQWLIAPMLPFQHFMTEKKTHFVKGRAFPLEYVRRILELNEPYPVRKETPIEEITAHYDARVNYAESWEKFFNNCVRGSMACSHCWRPEDFQYLVDDGKAHDIAVDGNKLVPGSVREDVNLGDVQNKDKQALQNYGRPYDTAGKAWGTYIGRALAPKIGPGGYEKWKGVWPE